LFLFPGKVITEDGRKVVFVSGQKVPLTVVKSDGGYTYDTSDLAALKQRVDDENGEWLIYVTDAGQVLYMSCFFVIWKCEIDRFTLDVYNLPNSNLTKIRIICHVRLATWYMGTGVSPLNFVWDCDQNHGIGDHSNEIKYNWGLGIKYKI